MYQCNPLGHKFDRPTIVTDESGDEQYDQCPECGTDDFVDLEDLRKDDAINDVLVTGHCLKSEAPVKDAVIFDMLDWCEKKLHLSSDQKTFLSERFDHVFEMGKGIGRLEILRDEIDKIKNQ